MAQSPKTRAKFLGSAEWCVLTKARNFAQVFRDSTYGLTFRNFELGRKRHFASQKGKRIIIKLGSEEKIDRVEGKKGGASMFAWLAENQTSVTEVTLSNPVEAFFFRLLYQTAKIEN